MPFLIMSFLEATMLLCGHQVLIVARSRQVCMKWLWKHCLFCRDCLWRERTSIYSWRLPRFAGDARSRLTGDAPLLHWRSPCASPAITLRFTGDHLVDDARLATPC